MTWRSGLSLIVELYYIGGALAMAALGGAWLAATGARLVRRWRCRREIARIDKEHMTPRSFSYQVGDVSLHSFAVNEWAMLAQIEEARRRELEGAATATDKHARRIH